MRVTIQCCAGVIGYAGGVPIIGSGEVSDVTRRIVADSDFDLTQERERDAFERVVSDSSITLGNMDGGVTSLFTKGNPTSQWDVNIYDNAGERMFWGRIVGPKNTNFLDKMVSLRVFSIDRLWIDLCKITTIPAWKQTNRVYTTVGEILNRVLIGDGRPLTQIGITEIEIDPLYKDRKIRDQADSSDPMIGNYGRFGHLDSTTTVKEVLDAFCIYYNAEFLVEPATGKFVMKRRADIINDTEYDLDAVIHRDGPVDADDTDQKKYDYIKISVGVPKPGAPEDTGKLMSFPNSYAVSKKETIYYAYTNVIKSGGIEIETPLSDPFKMEYENMYLDSKWVTIAPKYKLPGAPAGTQRQKIYRLYNDEAYLPFTTIVAEPVSGIFSINPLLEYEDGKLKQWKPLSASVDFNRFGNIFLQYDELLGRWNDNLVEAADSPQPKDGLIYEVKPVLRFYNYYRTEINNYSIIEMFYFFGAEINADEFKEQWIDTFRTRKLLRCTVSGTHYKYGDSFVSTKKLPGKYTVKKAVNKFIKKVTELELVTV